MDNLLSQLIDALPLPAALLDEEGRILAANSGLSGLLDHHGPSAALIGTTIEDLCATPGDCSAWKSWLRAPQGALDQELTLRGAGGRSVLVRHRSADLALPGGGRRFLEVFESAAEARETAAQLHESEERYRALFEVVPDAILAHSGDAIQFVNPAAVQLFGARAVEDLIGASVVKRIHPEDRAAVRRRIAEALEGMSTTAAEERWLRLDGSVIVAAVSAGPARIGGRPAVLAVLRDITARHQAEEALRRNEDALRGVQRLEAIGQLAGGAAHDFNNLLTVIRGHVALTLELLAEDDPVRPEIDAIDAAARRATALTQQLLAFGRRQRMLPRVLNPNKVVQEIERMARRLVQDRIRIELRLQDAVPNVRVDPDQLTQVMLNLVSNARDAMAEAGVIRIETDAVELGEDQLAVQPQVVPGRYLRLRVSDNGAGMDADTLAHAFEPFFTTKEQGAGTGLGLSTAYGIIKQSGGYIFADSEPGRGTTFSIYLPTVDDPEAPEAAETTDGVIEGQPQAERILLVEDEEGVRELARRVLERAGYEVLFAADGQRALSLLAERKKRIDLLLTDVVMPVLDGPKLAARFSRIDPDVPVLYMSGYSRAGMAGYALPEGATLLQKPFSPADLLQAVRTQLDRAK